MTLNDGRPSSYGLGWQLGSLGGHRQVHHGGGLPGFQAEFARFVDASLTIAVLVNLDDADVESIALGIAALYLPAAVPAAAHWLRA
jgi:D-alanyl-D-alanine carboxypeptidase